MPVKTRKKTKIRSSSLKRKKQSVHKTSGRRKTAPEKKGIRARSYLVLTRIKNNPIISPRPENEWEAWQTFNPGAILLNGKVHLLYRAIGADGLSRFGYANSGDGLNIDERPAEPAFVHEISHGLFYGPYPSGGSFGGAEDPRIVRVGNEDALYMTYTACDGGLGVGLTSIKINDFLQKKWKWAEPKLISPPGEVHKNWVIFPEKINGRYAVLHSLNPEILIDYFDDLEFSGKNYIKSRGCGNGKRGNAWDSFVRGAGPPPVKTRLGWLLFYHAIDERDPGKYKVGAMLLDFFNPAKILVRAKEPILEPVKYYENSGFKPGIVYASGAVVKDGQLLIYYGASDNFVSVAYTGLEEFLLELERGIKPNFEHKRLKGKKS